MEVIFGINKKYRAKKVPEGAHTLAMRVGARPTPLGAPLSHGPPGRPPVPIFCYMKSFTLKKNHKQAFGKKLRRHEAEPWRNQSRAPAELFCRGNFPPGGGNHRHRHHQCSLIGRGQSPSTSSPAPSPLKTLVHLLYPIFVPSLRLVPVGC